MIKPVLKNEDDLRLLTGSMPQIIWTATADGEVDFFNDRWYEYTGLTPEESMGWGWAPVIHPEDLDLCKQQWVNSIHTGEIYEIEYRFKRGADGEYRWHLGRAVPIKNSEGNILKWFGTSTDIHEQKSVNERLTQQQRLLERINNTNVMLAGELNLEKLIQSITDAATELTLAEFGAFFYNVYEESKGSYMLYTLSGVDKSAFERFPMPRATSLFGPTFRGEGIIRIDDVYKDDRYGKNPPYYGMPKGHLPVRSYLAIPVISRSGEVLGGLFFGHSSPGIFTEAAEDIVKGIAAQASIAIDNARLFNSAQKELEERKKTEEELKNIIKRQEAIAVLGQIALQEEDLQKMMDIAMHMTSATLKMEYAKVLKYYPEQNKLKLLSGVGWKPLMVGNAMVSAGLESQAGYTLISKEPVIVEDLKTEKRFFGPQLLFDHEVVSGVSVVIQGKDSPFGVMGVHSTKKRKFTKDESNFVLSVANIIAAAIERKNAEDRIANSLKEKEILLKEIHHRVKNNLQIISSLMRLQSNYLSDEAAKIFNESQARIRSMALVHERLYRASSMYNVKVKEYLNDLVTDLKQSYLTDNQKIEVVLDSEDIILNLDKMISVGLIVNELISNSFKYAFDGREEGAIKVMLREEEGQLNLVVKDNGRGFKQILNPEETNSLGLKLVHTLVDQLDGTLYIQNEDGAEFNIWFSAGTVKLNKEEL